MQIIRVSPSLNAADAPNRTRIGRAKKHTRKLQQQIERALAKGKTGKAQFFQRRLFGSFDAKLLATLRANKKLPHHKGIHKTRLVRHAEDINPWEGTDEPVQAHARLKPNGTFRPIMSYGIRGRALQQLLRLGMQPFMTPDHRQHATGNGGRDAAVAKIKEAVRTGYKWFIRLDIRDFYQNINERRFIDFVPAPRGVILNTLGPPRHIVIGSSSLAAAHALRWKCRKGLSQGASSSPIIAEIIIAWILEQIPSDAFVINFADDFAVMGRTQREAVALSQALASAVRRCPFGELQLEPKSTLRRVADGFEFLGYYFRYRRSRLRCEPTLANKMRFLVKAGCILKRASTQPLQARKLRLLVQHWSNAFSLWDTGPELLAPRLWLIELSRRFDAPIRAAVGQAMQ